MALDIVRLLQVSQWRAFDTDGRGRVLAGSDEPGSMQLVEIASEAGQAGAAVALTALPGAVSGRYVPGERTAVVQHDTGGDERSQLSLLDLRTERSGPVQLDDLQPLVRDPEHVHRLLDVLPGRVVYATNRRNGVDFDVVIRSALTGEEQVVYDRGGMVLEVAVSPDSRYVAITIPAEQPLSEQLVLVNTMPATEDEAVRAVTSPSVHARHTHVSWLPDASGLIVTSNVDRDRTGIARLDPATGSYDWLVRDEDHDLTGWLSPNGSTLLVQANDDGAARLSLHDAANGSLRAQVPLPADGWCSYPLPSPVWSPDSREVALSFSSATVPGDVLVVNAASGEVRRLTDSAAQFSDEHLVKPTADRVPTPDGERVPCLVYTPPRPSGSSVLLLHGGPEGQSVRNFNPVVQALVAQGHAVLAPNVRGSTGYGKRWYSADDGYRRPDAVGDLAAVHEWLPTLDLDPARAALWGGSYGGYLVLAGLAFQPGRWAAGVDIVGISSLLTFLENTAEYRRAHREREYGSPETDAEFLRAVSPLDRAAEIAAPLLVIHGMNDPRVPVSEAEQVAGAVRAKGVECDLLVYRDEGHGLAKRTNRVDAYTRAVAFLGRHLAG